MKINIKKHIRLVTIFTGLILINFIFSNSAQAKETQLGTCPNKNNCSLLLPIKPNMKILNYFDWEKNKYEKNHTGVDVIVDKNNPVYSPADAMVYFTGDVAGRPVLTLKLNHDMLITFDPLISKYKTNDFIERGSEVGVVPENFFHCASDNFCLHIGIRNDKTYLNPLLYFDITKRIKLYRV